MKIAIRNCLIALITLSVALFILTAGLSYQAEKRYPAKGALIQVGSSRIHVIDSQAFVEDPNTIGSQLNPIVLIHGASTSALDFHSNLYQRLSKTHRVIAVDRPGHGYSDRGSDKNMHDPAIQARIIMDTLQALNMTRPIIIGHSWGGAVAMASLVTQHESVQPVGAVVIAGATHTYKRNDSLPTSLSLNPIIGPLFRYQFLAPLGRLQIKSAVESVFTPEPMPDNYVDKTGVVLSLRPETFASNALDRANLSVHLASQSKQYPQIDVPVLSIASSDDNVVFPSTHHEKLIMDLRNVTAKLLQGAGHAPHWTRTDEVVDAIYEFIDQLDS